MFKRSFDQKTTTLESYVWWRSSQEPHPPGELLTDFLPKDQNKSQGDNEKIYGKSDEGEQSIHIAT